MIIGFDARDDGDCIRYAHEFMESSSETKANAEIEITPEMIEAGTSVLYGMELAFASEESWAERVYRAMASVRPS